MTERRLINMPKHAIPIDLHLCMDSRKEDCVYYNKVIIKTDYVSFDQGFCGFAFRKKKGFNCIDEISNPEYKGIPK